jgi:uncharacterized membrane protein (DUF4010 family)
MLSIPEEIAGLMVAFGIGLLVGIERERASAGGPEQPPAGVRTFALLALLGAASYTVGDTGFLVAGLFVAGAVIVSYLHTRDTDPGLTTEVAMLAVFTLGALATKAAAVAAGMGVVVTLVLAGKSWMHRFTRQVLTAQEMHDLLILAAAAFVVLPLLPTRPVDPWQMLDLHRLWYLVVALMSVSSTAYVTLRAFGSRWGLALAGLAGGFVSSTATIAAMGDAARANPKDTVAFASAGLLSNLATIIQMVVVLAMLSPDLLRLAAWPLAAAGAVAAGAAFLMGWRASSTSEAGEVRMGERPFDPRRVLGFATILTGILLFAAMMQRLLGAGSLPWVLGFAGFADVHAAAASAAQLVATRQVAAQPALVALLAAMTANSLGKCLMAVVRGGGRYALHVVPGIALMMVAFAAVMMAT